jgi:hypothetical protein
VNSGTITHLQGLIEKSSPFFIGNFLSQNTGGVDLCTTSTEAAHAYTTNLSIGAWKTATASIANTTQGKANHAP